MQYTKPPQNADMGQAITVLEFARIIEECIDQPHWRAAADKEADYADGNQLDSALLKRMQATGVPPAKENVIGPAIAAMFMVIWEIFSASRQEHRNNTVNP